MRYEYIKVKPGMGIRDGVYHGKYKEDLAIVRMLGDLPVLIQLVGGSINNPTANMCRDCLSLMLPV
jgi:hypothetical protein